MMTGAFLMKKLTFLADVLEEVLESSPPQPPMFKNQGKVGLEKWGHGVITIFQD
jgi:hypothetical protein